MLLRLTPISLDRVVLVPLTLISLDGVVLLSLTPINFNGVVCHLLRVVLHVPFTSNWDKAIHGNSFYPWHLCHFIDDINGNVMHMYIVMCRYALQNVRLSTCGPLFAITYIIMLAYMSIEL